MLYVELICSTRERVSESQRLIATTRNLIRGTAERIVASRRATGHVANPHEHIAFEHLWPEITCEQAVELG